MALRSPIFAHATREQLLKIAARISLHARLPFVRDAIPGAVLESILADVHGGQSLGTYDFIDVHVPSRRFGW
jgi:hypothetical protein